jgi:hypothetical protein
MQTERPRGKTRRAAPTAGLKQARGDAHAASPLRAPSRAAAIGENRVPPCVCGRPLSVEFEQQHAAAIAPNPSISANGSVAAVFPTPANGLTTSRASPIGVDFVAPQSDLSVNARAVPTGSAQAATTAVKGPALACGLSDL